MTIQLDPTVSLVQEFHEIFDCYIQDSPAIPPRTAPGIDALLETVRLLKKSRELLRLHGKEDVNCSRIALIVEEVAELATGYVENDLKAVLDAYLDIGYVVAGGVVNCGLQEVVVEGMDRVHESNLSKTNENGKAIYDDAGKVIKGPNYQKVDLSDLVDGTWLAAQKQSEDTTGL